jgi:hypothetical protein
MRSRARLTFSVGLAALIAALAPAAALGDMAFAQGGGRSSIIESEVLTPLDPWSVSALSRGERALPRGLWRSSEASILIPQLEAIPASIASPTALALARDALAAPADPPTGDSRAAARKRVETLARIGAGDEVLALASGALRDDMVVAVYAAQAELSKNRLAEACRRTGAITAEDAPAFVLRMRAVCFAHAGDADSAALALEVATAKNAGDPWLAPALRAMSGLAPAAAGPRTPATLARFDSSINAAVSLAANLAPARENPLAGSSLFAARLLSISETAPAELRAEATVRLVRLGLMSAATGRAQLNAAINTANRNPPRLVALSRDVAAAALPDARASLLRNAIDAASSTADAAAIYRMFRPELNAMLDDPALTAGAASFARGALASGEVSAAQAWRAKADRARSDARAIAAIDVGLALAGTPNPDAMRFAAERRAEAAGPTALRDVTALYALGAPIQGAAAALITAPRSARPSGSASARQQEIDARLASLSDAVQRRAAGEVALLVAALSAEGAHRMEPETLDAALRALTSAGLDGYAQRLAVEAVLAAPGQPTSAARPAAAPQAPRKR